MKRKEKHKHLLNQRNFLDASVLKCRCGLTFEWSIIEQKYEQTSEGSK